MSLKLHSHFKVFYLRKKLHVFKGGDDGIVLMATWSNFFVVLDKKVHNILIFSKLFFEIKQPRVLSNRYEKWQWRFHCFGAKNVAKDMSKNLSLPSEQLTRRPLVETHRKLKLINKYYDNRQLFSLQFWFAFARCAC